ncbi:hypothetical protein TcasGA2_TC034234 [Tribolium castaneum]|uniref:Uncharacterized protein n=1 Tax=Tribolium castaneum TaxID=7070 RepID=A0A139WC53_TRICA|nr:hypothetical protein TcasGA2_TC034234 [Tribolium castaneum]
MVFWGDTARRNASFSRDLCLWSSQWLIVEVFTAPARMEQALIAPVANHRNVPL